MIWKKPADLHYTDLCIYIDANISKIAEPGKYPEVEDTVYNYLWLVVKALAIKKRMFNDFSEYDAYSFYAARRLYLSLRKNIWNQGKVIKGKQIKPIKSCLNYMKAIMYAMKVEYQNETYRKVISEEFADKNFDVFRYQGVLREHAKEAQGQSEHFWNYLTDSLSHSGELIDKVLGRSLFNKNSAEYQRLKISLMLSLINAINTQQKLTSKCQVILWKLPKTMNNYVKLLFMEVCTEIKNEIVDCAKMTAISDEVADTVLTNTLFERYNNDYED